MFGPIDESVPELELSSERMAHLLGEIKRNSRHRRIAMVSTVLLVAAVMGAWLAAPPQHGGLALTADAEDADSELPRVFGSNGVWRLAEPIAEDPGDLGPASVVEAPTNPDAPSFTLSPPDEEDFNSLPTSTSTPPTSTSGQSRDAIEALQDPSELDWSEFVSVIVIESEVPDDLAEDAAPAEAETDPAETVPAETASGETVRSENVTEDVIEVPATDEQISPPEEASEVEPAEASSSAATTPDESTPANDDTTTAVEPQPATQDLTGANPSTPSVDPTNGDSVTLGVSASIMSPSVVVYSAHVSVTVQVVDDDSSVIDWCQTRVDWGDGSVTRATAADDAALCTAPCEPSAPSSASGISETGVSETLVFEHEYQYTIDAAPRIFVATGDGCSYSLAELQLPTFTVVPLS